MISAAFADHLDALGHFRDPAHDPPHVDWLMSGRGFDRAHFEALMDDVARFIATGASPPRRRASHRNS